MMTESVRRGEFSPDSSGTPFEPSTPDASRRWAADRASADAGRILRSGEEEAGIDPADLSDDDLTREMASLHRTRLDTLRHGSDTALATHLRRTAELETEYLTRFPGREVDPARLRDG